MDTSRPTLSTLAWIHLIMSVSACVGGGRGGACWDMRATATPRALGVWGWGVWMRTYDSKGPGNSEKSVSYYVYIAKSLNADV
jgi:hypothetical protein